MFRRLAVPVDDHVRVGNVALDDWYLTGLPRGLDPFHLEECRGSGCARRAGATGRALSLRRLLREHECARDDRESEGQTDRQSTSHAKPPVGRNDITSFEPFEPFGSFEPFDSPICRRYRTKNDPNVPNDPNE